MSQMEVEVEWEVFALPVEGNWSCPWKFALTAHGFALDAIHMALETTAGNAASARAGSSSHHCLTHLRPS